MIRSWFLVPVSLAACATPMLSSHPITGEWGGTHVGLSLTPNGGTLEYDCASGTLAGPLVPRRDGTFDAQGIHTPGWGGPEIEGQVLPSYRVSYSGSVRGDVMNLRGRLENGVSLGPFVLRRGREPIIFRCL